MTGEQTDSDFAKDALEAHNKYRYQHESPPMTLDKGMSEEAIQYAKNFANGEMAKRSSTPYGENLYTSCGIPVSGEAVTKAWYDEVKDYNFQNPQASTGVTGIARKRVDYT